MILLAGLVSPLVSSSSPSRLPGSLSLDGFAVAPSPATSTTAEIKPMILFVLGGGFYACFSLYIHTFP